MAKKTDYCNTCSFNSVCEYKSDTKRFCVDRNDAKLDMSETELRTRLLDDRKTELSSAIGLLIFLGIVGLFLFVAFVPNATTWVTTTAWPAILTFIMPILKVAVNAIMSIFYLAMILVMLAGALMLLFVIGRSVLVIITHIKRRFAHA